MTLIPIESIAKSGKGNDKIGRSIAQFSRMHGLPEDGGTCPGASDWCRENCYVQRITRQYAQSHARFVANSAGDIPDDIPTSGRYRIHVSGDFDTAPYIRAWIAMAQSRPNVAFWAYTRSWRVPRLMRALEDLRALPNVQLFASTDPSIADDLPDGWRVARIDSARGYACPEQSGRKPDCNACSYCITGQSGDVAFTSH
jgi:hypothetical protein